MLEQGAGSGPGAPVAAVRGSIRDRVESAVREALLTGRFVPGRAVTLRGLASELGVSPMPVREAVRSLSAGHALEVRPNGRIQVPTMTEARLAEILKARLLLEPELAEMAASYPADLDADALAALDDRVDESLIGGDAETYMRFNHAFHFHIYRASRSEVLLPLVENLWLQFAPFMRTVYGRVGTAALDDHHKEAVQAVRDGDAEALRSAVAADIRCGMELLDR
ncbi:GntR family transcriptional regulator [Stappia indica]|uniref:GntR family transcriptional regulator n=1 Tax=Stappia indica TaxID=538381 RepID=UPI001CD368DE|nr:GntR family transcriptional regulator [Stappia indica]MCA1297651.1 GntR family transcriptional regulator [Stappia indica]